jgi:hypothetical protein
MDKPLKLRELRHCLRKYDVEEDPSRGKGSHTLFYKIIDGKMRTYPVPQKHGEVKKYYVRECRKKFLLTAEDGVPDGDFYA